MSQRLQMLQAMTQKSSDPFALYALAMEYSKLERHDEALETFVALRGKQPDYLPMYLMAGQLYCQQGRNDEGREWLQAGIELAGRQGNTHALSELQSALSAVETG